jgi:hypothetical protein
MTIVYNIIANMYFYYTIGGPDSRLIDTFHAAACISQAGSMYTFNFNPTHSPLSGSICSYIGLTEEI